MIFGEEKRYYVERRLRDRMAATGTESFASYYSRLRTDTQDEFQHFVNAFTVNETYFYREDYQLRCLTSDLMRERSRDKPAGEPIRIWSAACSSGEEPYSIAIWLLENWPGVDEHLIEIVGSDIDTRVLEQARAGTYGERALMRLSPQLIGKYFETLGPQQWRIVPQLRDSVSFAPVNLVLPEETRPQGRFDVIFCRNVLIYFDDASRRIAAENLYENLHPGGFVCLGHTESMSRISALFQVRRFTEAVIYQRPGSAGA